MLTFFHLTPKDKITIHKDIIAISYFSKGAISAEYAYNMPVNLRNFYLMELESIKETEAAATKSVIGSSNQNKK